MQVKNIPWFEDWEPEYFTAVLRMEPALDLCNARTRKSLEDYLGENFSDLGAVRDCLRELVEKYRNRGAVGIKLAHAYQLRRVLDNQPKGSARSGKIESVKVHYLVPSRYEVVQELPL